MSILTFLYKINRDRQRHLVMSDPKGFTLLELLVAMFLASTIITVLLLTTNELIASDNRESKLTETQRNMQTALDYIGNELQEAVYVYDQNCLDGTNTDAGCPGFFKGQAEIDALLPPLDGYGTATRTPILTFWKQQPLSDDIKDICANLEPDENGQAVLDLLSANQISCAAGHAYSLVVYAYSQDGSEDALPWAGKGGIIRYEMAPSTEEEDLDNYISPFKDKNIDFQGWPYEETAQLGKPEILVDFVDDFGSPNFVSDCQKRLGTTYVNTSAANPSDDTPTTGFFACVNTASTLSDGTDSRFGNQDVVLYLRGNVYGPASQLQQATTSLPTLESRVYLRGVIGRRPSS